MRVTEPFWLAVFDPKPTAEPAGTGEVRFFLPGSSALTVRLAADCNEVSHALDRDERCGVIFDGVLYDRDSVATFLRARRSAEDASNALFLLDAYLHAGPCAAEAFDGEFSALIWDGRTDSLIAVRDPVGHRPLFYAAAGTTVVFSPSPELTARVSGASTDPNRGALAEWVLAGTTALQATLFAGVRRLPPGHLLEVRGGRLLARRYWLPERREWPNAELDEVLEQFDTLFDQAVERNLPPGRVGVFLSGGVDSSLVAASAREALRRQNGPIPLAISLKFPDSRADEETMQRAVARDLALDHAVVPMAEATEPFGVLMAGIRLSERSWFPCVNPWGAAYDRLAELGRSAGCEVILDGEGGNQLLELKSQWAAHELRRGHLRSLVELWRVERGYSARPTLERARDLLLRQGLRAAVRHEFHWRLRRVSPEALRRWLAWRADGVIPGWLAPDRQVRRELIDSQSRLPEDEGLRDPYARALRTSLDSSRDAESLERAFLSSRRTAVRRRSPFYDSQLIRLINRVPPRLFFVGDRWKALAYESYHRRVQGESARMVAPASFGEYFENLLETESKQVLGYLGGLPLLEELGVVARTAARHLLDPRAPITHYQRWQLLATEAWLKARLTPG